MSHGTTHAHVLPTYHGKLCKQHATVYVCGLPPNWSRMLYTKRDNILRTTYHCTPAAHPTKGPTTIAKRTINTNTTVWQTLPLTVPRPASEAAHHYITRRAALLGNALLAAALLSTQCPRQLLLPALTRVTSKCQHSTVESCQPQTHCPILPQHPNACNIRATSLATQPAQACTACTMLQV